LFEGEGAELHSREMISFHETGRSLVLAHHNNNNNNNVKTECLDVLPFYPVEIK